VARAAGHQSPVVAELMSSFSPLELDPYSERVASADHALAGLLA
jgi:hypothetical protein